MSDGEQYTSLNTGNNTNVNNQYGTLQDDSYLEFSPAKSLTKAPENDMEMYADLNNEGDINGPENLYEGVAGIQDQYMDLNRPQSNTALANDNLYSDLSSTDVNKTDEYLDLSNTKK